MDHTIYHQNIDVAWANTHLEEASLNIKKLLCEGSFLKGYTPRTTPIPREKLWELILDAQRAVLQIAADAGFDPIDVTEHVHAGR
jgi:hypothetical protein